MKISVLGALLIMCIFLNYNEGYCYIDPLGGDNFDHCRIGQSRLIKWDTCDFHNNINIYLWNMATSSFTTIASNIAASPGQYNWSIPTNLQAGTFYRIKIQEVANPKVYSMSLAFFQILPIQPKIPSNFQFTERTEPIRFEIHPNPVSDVLNISWTTNTAKELAVFDSFGNPLRRIELNKERELHLSMKDLSNGFYYVNLVLENGEILSHKFVKFR